MHPALYLQMNQMLQVDKGLKEWAKEMMKENKL